MGKVQKSGSTNARFELPETEELFGGQSTERRYSERSAILGRSMMSEPGENLMILCSSSASYEKPNIGLQKFTRAGTSGNCWGGPILVLRQWEGGVKKDALKPLNSGAHDSDADPDTDTATVQLFRDISLTDVRHAADFFSAAHRGAGTLPSHVRALAVSVACEADVQAGRPKISEVVINGLDPVYVREDSDMGNLIGLPLLVRKDVGPFLASGTSAALLKNEEAALLKLDLVSATTKPGATKEDYKKAKKDYKMIMMMTIGSGCTMFGELEHDGRYGFGSLPVSWANDLAGSAVIARADGLPPYSRHFEVICQYIKLEVERLIASALQGLSPGSVVPDRETVLKALSKDSFMDFFNDYKSVRSAEDAFWKDLPSP